MVNTKNELDNALEYAFANSRGADIIIEEFVEADGAPIEGNGFAVDGKLTTHAWADVYSDLKADNPITPVCFCYPSDKPQSQLKKLDETLQRLLTLLDMKTNAYNIEARIDKQGNIYLMEVAPRNGGNTSHDILSFLTGKDIQKAILLAALGEDCSFMDDTVCTKYWMGYVVHSNIKGIYTGMQYDEKFRINNLQRYTPFVEKGSEVESYSGTNCTIGALLASFDTREDMMIVAKEVTRKFSPSVLPH
jgi:biotin carboxylase